MKTTARRSAVLAGLALTLAWAGIAPAAVANPTNEPARSDKPHTVHVAGRQIPVDVANGLWEMRGALVGEWHAVPTTVLHSDPNRPTLVLRRRRRGFHRLHRPPSKGRQVTARDHRGELHATFLTWASFESDGATLIKGHCVHPITGGKGAFAGARGLIKHWSTRPVDDQIKTTYSGYIVLKMFQPGRRPHRPQSPRQHPPVTLATSARRSC